jgi:hypothetical protein
MLPRAVREQAERAEAAHAALLNTGTPAQIEAQAAPVEVQPVVTEVVPVVVTPVAPTVAQTPDPWELKYRVLNGKYAAEVPRLAAELRDARAQLASAQATPTVVSVAASAPSAAVTAVTEQYGEDFATAVQAIASAATQPLRDELSSRTAAVEAQTAENGRQGFLRDLSTHVQNWQTIDRDPGFTAYLDEFDAMSGRTRREFFNEADARNDSARVATFFATYQRSTSTVTAPAVEPAPSVEHLISPDSSRASEAPPGQKHWTVAEIKQFYVDARKGQYTPAEFARLDSDISLATVQGRIR